MLGNHSCHLLFTLLLLGFLGSGQELEDTSIILSKLSNPLVLNSGEKISTKQQWFDQRRPELLDFFTTQIYGQSPPTNGILSFEVIESTDDALKGLATRKQIALKIKGDKGAQIITLLLYIPHNQNQPPPVFLGLNFNGNQSITSETEILITQAWVPSKSIGSINNKATDASRGIASAQWPLEFILNNGYAVATVYAGEIAPDYKEGYTQGVQSIFPDLQGRPDNFSTMGAWAWGLSRVMDYLETDSQVDSQKVLLFGTSRLGKAALWAGATDNRFAMVISNESGAGGAKLYHHRYQEDIAQICRVFPHWFSKNFQQFNGRDTELPFDQHLLMALIAPRPLLVASAREAYVCDPVGEFLGTLATSPVYEFLGVKPLPIVAFPNENEPAYGTIGYYLRSGKHDITQYDWEQFLAFAKANSN